MTITSKLRGSKCESPSFTCYNKLYKAKRKVTFQLKSSRKKKLKAFRCERDAIWKLYSKRKKKKKIPMETLMQ